jgi:hypothetical protein
MKRPLPLITMLSVILLTAFSVQQAYSQPLLVENFQYEVGDLPVNPASIWNSANSGTTAKVIDESLSYSGYALSGTGRSITMKDGLDYNTSVGTTTSGAVYTAFLLKVSATTVAGDYFFHFTQAGTIFKGRLWLKQGSAPDKYLIGIAKSGTTPAVQYTTTEYTTGATNMIVLKYLFNSATTTDDEVSIFVDPVVGSEEPVAPTIIAADNSTTDATQITLVALRQGGSTSAPSVTIDAIRVATTWNDAVNASLSADLAPPSFSSGFPKTANINTTHADLQVSMDEPGKAYYVVVPDGATAPLVAEVVAGTSYGTVTLVANGTIDVLAGGTTYSATLTGLADKTNYDIYVVAEDDETTPNRQTETTKVDLYTIRPPDVLLNVDFETANSLNPFTQVSITGDQVWIQSTYSNNGFAKMSGYSGGAKDNEDWLISPAINLASAETVNLSFSTAMDFEGGSFKVMISSNFSGTYSATDIAAATWTDITPNFALSTDGYVWVPSGEFSLTGYTGNIFVAFVYTSTTTGAATWEVDNVKITGYLIPGSDASLSDLKADGVTVPSFDPATLTYEMVLEASVTAVPVVTYTTTDPTASIILTNATNLSGDAAARTTQIKVIAADGVTTQTYSILFNPIIAVADLAALRAVAAENYTRIYQVTGEVVVSGINDSQRHQKYIQDASAGILIDDADAKITTAYSVGDGIKGLTGTLTEYNKLLEFIPYRNPGAASSTGNTLTPQVITVAQFTGNQETYESELVKIVGVKFTDANGTAVFQEKKNYSISVGSDVTILRTIFLGTDLNGKVIPHMADVTGIATVFATDAQLTPRNFADFVVYSSDATLSDLKVSGTTVTGFASGTMTYNVSLPAGTTAVPAVTATPAEANATVAITPATSLTGDVAARTTTVKVTSHDQSVNKNYTVVFSVATGIEDNPGAGYRIYPVPAHEQLTAAGLSGITLIEVFDVTGDKVSAIRCEGDSLVNIPVGHLPRGIYFVRLTTEKGAVMKRFVKE